MQPSEGTEFQIKQKKEGQGKEKDRQDLSGQQVVECFHTNTSKEQFLKFMRIFYKKAPFFALLLWNSSQIAKFSTLDAKKYKTFPKNSQKPLENLKKCVIIDTEFSTHIKRVLNQQGDFLK